MIKGWMGKRLCVDLESQRSWVEEIPAEDLRRSIGGRALNAKYLAAYRSEPSAPSSRSPVAFSVGPLAGTPAPCSGWTTISTPAPYSPPASLHGFVGGHWGPSLKFAGFDQLIVLGKAETPVYVCLVDGKVRIEPAHKLWGRNVLETTVALQRSEKGDHAEVLCIGPAGEKLIAFSNLTTGCSWTADHAGLGAVFGDKKLKAIVVSGTHPVRLHEAEIFLERCTRIREKIRREPLSERLREEGPFFFLGEDPAGLGMRNYREQSGRAFEGHWKSEYLSRYLAAKEGCFSCPVHCGRVSEVNGDYFGGVHLESAWSLGPRMGVNDWEKTLQLVRTCQQQGLDPTSTGSLISWVMECCEDGILSSRELDLDRCEWGSHEGALRIIELILSGTGLGEIFRRGTFEAARQLGKGLELVPHFWGMDLPVRDPRSSPEFHLSRALFPLRWDYLQSFITPDPSQAVGGPQRDDLVEKVSSLQKQRIVADMYGVCPLIFSRLSLLTVSDLEELVSAATGFWEEPEQAVKQAQETEKSFPQRNFPQGINPIPDRFLKQPEERDFYERFRKGDGHVRQGTSL